MTTTSPQVVHQEAADIGGAQPMADARDDHELSGRSRRWWPAAVCLVLYTLATVLLFGHLSDLGPATMTGGRTADQITQVWWLEWAQYALAHGHNLLFTNWQNYPVGYNFGVNGSMLALGVLFSPITTIFGPVVAWNVLLRLAIIASAFSMCLVLRRWTTWWPAAFVGGAVYAFSGYMLFYASGYLFLTFAAIPPLIFLTLYELMVRQRWPAVRTGALLAVLCAVQYLIFPELLASSLVLGAVGCVIYILFNGRAFKAAFAYVKRAVVAALVVGAVALGGPLLFAFFGTQHSNGGVGSPTNLETFHGDLFGPVVPSGRQLFHGTYPSGLAAHVLTPSMYIGLPLLIAVAATVWVLRRRGIVVLAGVLLVFSFLLSLGTVLYVDGHDTHIPLPLTLFDFFPITDGFQSTRFSLFTSLFAGAILACGIEELRRRVAASRLADRTAPRLRPVLASAVPLSVVAVLALINLPAGTQAAEPTDASPFFSSSAAKRIPAGSVVLAYPYPDPPYSPGGSLQSLAFEGVNDMLVDQAVAGLPFRLIGGYGWRPTKGLYESPRPSPLYPASVQALFDSAFTGVARRSQASLIQNSNVTDDLQTFLRRYHVGTVVVLPVGHDPATVVAHLSAALGPPEHHAGATVWFDVQDRLGLSPTDRR